MNTANIEAQFLDRTGQLDDADARALERVSRAIQALGTNSLSTPDGRTEAPAGDVRLPPPGMEPVSIGQGEYARDAEGRSLAPFPVPVPVPATKLCKLCGSATTGSVGAAGIRWSFICQPCKNAEDRAALRALGGPYLPARQAQTLIEAANDLLAVIHEDMTHEQQRFRAEAIEAARDAVDMAKTTLKA